MLTRILLVLTALSLRAALEVCKFTNNGDRAGCLCQTANGVQCIDRYKGISFTTYTSENTIPSLHLNFAYIVSDNGNNGSVTGDGCRSVPTEPGYVASGDFASVCTTVFGICNIGSTTACCKTSGCTACHPYESGCSTAAPTGPTPYVAPSPSAASGNTPTTANVRVDPSAPVSGTPAPTAAPTGPTPYVAPSPSTASGNTPTTANVRVDPSAPVSGTPAPADNAVRDNILAGVASTVVGSCLIGFIVLVYKRCHVGVRRARGDTMTYECKRCDKMYNSEADLKIHVAKAHAGTECKIFLFCLWLFV